MRLAYTNEKPSENVAAIAAQIVGLLAEAGASTLLRTSNGFHAAARKAIGTLRGKGGRTAER